MTLKTLQDIDFEDGSKNRIAFSGQLKQEAIKEVKLLRKDYLYLDEDDICRIRAEAKIEYIIWKNNLKEDDLK